MVIHTQGRLASLCCALVSVWDLIPSTVCRHSLDTVALMGCHTWTGQNIFTSSRSVRRLSESCCTRWRTSSKPFGPYRHLNKPLPTHCHINNINHHESEGRDHLTRETLGGQTSHQVCETFGERDTRDTRDTQNGGRRKIGEVYELCVWS